MNKKNKINNLIQTRSKNLSDTLEQAISSPLLTYSQICEIDHQGLYIIFDDTDILYIGKTSRTGKVRMRELASDFRSHTFNKKLLSKRFRDFGFVFKVLEKETKKEWINDGKITDEDFKGHQKEINQHIRQKLKFRFHKEQDERILSCLEYFAIAIFDPIYND